MSEAEEAFCWYEDERAESGYDFLLQVDAGINFINPTFAIRLVF
jgi:hypothetical protein